MGIVYCPFDMDVWGFLQWETEKSGRKKIKPESNSAHMHPHVFATKSVISNFSQRMQRLLDIHWQP